MCSSLRAGGSASNTFVVAIVLGTVLCCSHLSKSHFVGKSVLMLSQADLYLLSDESSFPAIVHSGLFPDVSMQASCELQRLLDHHLSNPQKELFEAAGIGSDVDKVQKVKSARGDLRCWLVPTICKEHSLVAVQEIIKRIMSVCKGQLKTCHGLNGEYSVQATLYVSPCWYLVLAVMG
jgi:hypothetical protein